MERQIAPVRLDDLIKAAFTKARRNHERLGREAKRYALRIVQARAPDLPNDIQEEVFTQAFIELFRATPEEVEAIGGKRLFRKAVFKGIRAVRAVYPPAGARTRLNTKRYGDVAAEDIGRIPDQKALERASVEEGGHARLDLHMLADPAATSAIKQCEDRMEIEDILRRAPPDVGRALRLIHLLGDPVEDVAADLLVSRFALGRRITAFCETWRAAA